LDWISIQAAAFSTSYIRWRNNLGLNVFPNPNLFADSKRLLCTITVSNTHLFAGNGENFVIITTVAILSADFKWVFGHFRESFGKENKSLGFLLSKYACLQDFCFRYLGGWTICQACDEQGRIIVLRAAGAEDEEGAEDDHQDAD
jgi:hypothetical protein